MADKDKEETPKSDKGITIERIKEIGREVGEKHLPKPDK